jgi:hypothetical protein
MNVRKYCESWFYCYLQLHQKINLNSMRAAYYLSALILFLSGCQKTDVSNNQLPKNSTIEGLTTASISTTSTCDFQLTETTLTGAGWAKVFDEDFSTDLSKWNIWTGGAYNNELQLYQAANLTINGGILSIAAKKESKTGPVTPGSSTTKTFGFTSGRIESKTLFSANASIPKVRFSARIKLPSGNGMWPAFWTYGDPLISLKQRDKSPPSFIPTISMAQRQEPIWLAIPLQPSHLPPACNPAGMYMKWCGQLPNLSFIWMANS